MNASADIKHRIKLGEHLVTKGLATADQVDIALTEQKKTGLRI